MAKSGAGLLALQVLTQESASSLLCSALLCSLATKCACHRAASSETRKVMLTTSRCSGVTTKLA